jgi:hypothetical protein
MPQFWIAIFFILLAIAQLYESIKEIDLPLPIYLILGTILAIASNSQQQFSFNSNRQSELPIIPVADAILNCAEVKSLSSIKSLEITKVDPEAIKRVP